MPVLFLHRFSACAKLSKRRVSITSICPSLTKNYAVHPYHLATTPFRTSSLTGLSTRFESKNNFGEVLLKKSSTRYYSIWSAVDKKVQQDKKVQPDKEVQPDKKVQPVVDNLMRAGDPTQWVLTSHAEEIGEGLWVLEGKDWLFMDKETHDRGLFVRQSTRSFYEEVVEVEMNEQVQSGLDWTVIAAGTTGIGKSCASNYILAQWLWLNKTRIDSNETWRPIIIHYALTGKNTVITEDFKALDLETAPRLFRSSFMRDPMALCIVDTGSGAQNPYEIAGFTVILPSPAAAPKEAFKKWLSTTPCILPPYTLDEAEALRHHLEKKGKINLTSEDLKKRFNEAGGIIRYLFGSERFCDSYLSERDEILDELPLEELLRIIRSASKSPTKISEIHNKIVHLRPRRFSEQYDGKKGIDPWHSARCVSVFASNEVESRMLQLMKTKSVKEQLKILRRYLSVPSSRIVGGKMFQDIFHDFIVESNAHFDRSKVSMEQLYPEGSEKKVNKEDIVFAKSSSTFQGNKAEEMPTKNQGELRIAESPTYPAVESGFVVDGTLYLFQTTVSVTGKTASMKNIHHIKKIVCAWCKDDVKHVKFVFVIDKMANDSGRYSNEQFNSLIASGEEVSLTQWKYVFDLEMNVL